MKSPATIKTPAQKRAVRTAAKPPEAAVPPSDPQAQPAAPKGKLGILVELLSRPSGATIADLAIATGWQDHSVRGALAGALKKRGLVVSSEKIEGVRTYKLPAPANEGA